MSRRIASVALVCVLVALSTWAVADETSSMLGKCASQIVYQSDTDDAYKYLENQQRQIYTQNPGLVDPYSRAELENPRSMATFAELKARALKACPDPSLRVQCALDPDIVDRLMKALPCLTLPTRFEAPLLNSLINLYTDQLNEVRVSHLRNLQ